MNDRRNTRMPMARWLLPFALCVPLPALASDPVGMLTMFFGLPVFTAAVVVLGVLVIFRRHRWARGIGLLLGIPVSLLGVYLAYVDTWRFWPDRNSSDDGTQMLIVVGWTLLWAGVLWFTWLFWRAGKAALPATDAQPGRYP